MSSHALVKLVVGIAASSAAVYAVTRYGIAPNGPIPMSPGFGVDDVVLGAAPILALALVNMAVKKGG